MAEKLRRASSLPNTLRKANSSFHGANSSFPVVQTQIRHIVAMLSELSIRSAALNSTLSYV
jgi:hypothetical protein